MKKYFNYIREPLVMSKKLAKLCSHSGDCDEDVSRVSQLPEIARQLKKIDPAELVKELSEYGAWDETELSDHSENLNRILWISAGDILEGNI